MQPHRRSLYSEVETRVPKSAGTPTVAEANYAPTRVCVRLRGEANGVGSGVSRLDRHHQTNQDSGPPRDCNRGRAFVYS
jgi:hypothetical protein